MYDEKKKMFEERWKKVDEGKKEMKQNLGSLTINDETWNVNMWNSSLSLSLFSSQIIMFILSHFSKASLQ